MLWGRDLALGGAEAVGLFGPSWPFVEPWASPLAPACCRAPSLFPAPRRAPVPPGLSGPELPGNQEIGDLTPARRHLGEVGHHSHMEHGSPPGEACGVTLLGTPSDLLLAPVWSLSLATAPVSVSPGPSGWQVLILTVLHCCDACRGLGRRAPDLASLWSHSQRLSKGWLVK